MSGIANVTVSIRAVVQHGAGKEIHVGRQVTAAAGDGPEDVRNAVTTALRQVNEEIKGHVR